MPGSGIYAENDTLKNGTSRIGLYASAPPPPPPPESNMKTWISNAYSQIRKLGFQKSEISEHPAFLIFVDIQIQNFPILIFPWIPDFREFQLAS